MIVTKNWLNEWVDLSDKNIDEILETLNKIGLEVAEHRKLVAPDNVVVGKVVSCQKHPDADKLNLCQVDVGEERLQIVCGAKNVKEAQYVAVAKVGATLPGDFKIKPAKLRGVESLGMICSSNELGFEKMENGIMVLDESVGELEPGKKLSEYPLFNDDLIEIELTANRGDCLSVLGIARELAAAFGKRLKNINIEEDSSLKLGIGRVLKLNASNNLESSVKYKVTQKEHFYLPFLVRFRLALAKELFENAYEAFGFYVTYSTGVITRIYDFNFFDGQIELKKDELDYDAVYGNKKASVIGVIQYEESKGRGDRTIVEFSYIDPKTISKKMFQKKIESDWAFYRSSRGSEPRLDIGKNFLIYLYQKLFEDYSIYEGSLEAVKEIEKEAIKINLDEIDALIGQKIDRGLIVDILKALGFEILSVDEEFMIVKTPVFRHDIENIQDVAEEILRIYGIDNIESKALRFEEKNRLNRAYENFLAKKEIKAFSIANGYFETIGFVFTSKEFLEKYGFKTIKEDKELVNPITSELNTLRTSLIPTLIEQTRNNIKNGAKRVKLFEIGTVFDEERAEKEVFGGIFCGTKEVDTIVNKGKPSMVEFGDVVRDLADILGDFDLVKSAPKHSICHPYQCADIVKEGQRVGYVAKIDPRAQEELDLYEGFIFEIDFDKIQKPYPKFRKFSIYQRSFKDLSVVVDKDLSFEDIKKTLSVPKEIKNFYPVDIYEDEKLGDKKSLTLRFAVQSDEKTLTEEEIGSIINSVLKSLEKIGAKLR